MACRYTYQGKTYEAHEFDDVLRAIQPSEASKYMSGVSSVPSAPMIGDTKAWTALALKRMIAYATENGFDSIAWTTGEQQAERYDLSKQVDSIGYRKDGEDTYEVSAIKDGDSVMVERGKTAKQLEEIVGKEIAKKIVDGEGVPRKGGGNVKDLSGLDLKVGGEGMKGYYDEIVPQVANDILKKIGGGRIEGVVIGQAQNGLFDVVDSITGEVLEKDMPEGRANMLHDGWMRQKRLVRLMPKDGDMSQPGFTITPEMRAKVRNEGLPLFSKEQIARMARDPNFLMKAVKALIDSDTSVLKFPHSKATSIKGALEDMFGAYGEMENPATGEVNKKDWGNKLVGYGSLTHDDGTVVHTFSTPNNESFSVTEHKDGRVHINVSNLLNGGFGQVVYIAVADYAKNSSEATGKDKVFVADSAGLTDDSLIRRTTNMLSVVTRHGTAKYIMPGVEQLEGDAKLGVPPLKWGRTDVDKFNALAQTFVDTIYNAMPDLKEAHYDYAKQGFFTGSGRPLDGAFFAGGANSSAARAIRAGESSIRRAVFLQSLMDSEGKSVGERESILGELSSNRLSADERGVKALFSKRQSSIPDAAQPAAQPTKQGSIPLQGGKTGNSASWDSPESSRMDDILYLLQDKHIDMKRAIEKIKAAGHKIVEKFNPYLAEELFHGRAAKRTHDFVDTELKPLMVDMKARGLDLNALDKFLHARHAKEANALIADRDPNMQDGGSGMTNAEADKYMSSLDPATRKRLEAVAVKVDAIIAKTRDLYVSYGLISKDQADGWADMFRHYVPLMREDHDGGMGIGQGFSIKGKEVKHRTGSTAKVVDILANIALQREKAIVRGEKNRVAVALAGLVKLNPNPDFWSFGRPPIERILNEKTGLIEDRIDPTFKSKPNVVVAKIKDASGNVHERAVIFNEHNERAVRMAESLKNLDHIQLGGVMGVSAVITRYFASINTQYNPVFGLVNIMRDTQAMALNLSSTPIAEHRADVLKLIPAAVAGIYQDSRSERKGKAATSKWAQLWEEMQNEGGMTGYRDLYRDSADRAGEIESELNPTKWHDNALGKIFTANGTLKMPLAIAQEKAGWLFGLLSDYNQALEGATRLATYKVAIDNGMSKKEASSLAKNITVNFNRKGQIGQQAGALYAFFNAAMQGTARIAQTVLTYQDGKVGLTKAGKAIVHGGVLLGVMQAVALAAAGFDDDEPPEFVRERSLVIPIGGKRYITIPMPLGFHVLPNLGRVPTEWAMNGFTDTGRRMTDLLGIIIEAFNPMGNAGMSLQTFMPTAIDPMVALAENKDWTGKTIYKEDYNSLKPTPGFERNKDTATVWAKAIAEGMDMLTGGTGYTPGAVSPTADQIDFLIGQVTGGVGREIGKLAQTTSAVITGEALPPHKIPVVGRLYGNADAQASQGGAYYSNIKKIYQIEAEIKGRLEDGLPVDEYRNKHPEWKLITRAKYADNIIKKLKKQKREMIERGAERARIVDIDNRITNEMRRLNEAAHD